MSEITKVKTPNSIPFRTPKGSLGFKLIIVCALVVLMAIPAMFISYISYERSGRAKDVTAEVSERYGGEQYVTGPFLTAPYIQTDTNDNVTESGNYIVFADKGEADFLNIETQIRRRSLFKVPTYQAEGRLTGEFKAMPLASEMQAVKIDWNKAQLVMALSDVRGLKRDVELELAGGEVRKFGPANFDDAASAISIAPVHIKAPMRGETPRSYRSRVQASDGYRKFGWLNAGSLQTYLAVPAGDLAVSGEEFKVSVNLSLGGAKRLGITPFAQSTHLKIGADWADPGFEGGFPPDDRTITNSGFTAGWSVPYLRRGIRAHGKAHTLSALTASNKLMTVQFVSTDNPYQTVNRALKYAVMFIGLVFLAYFLFEVIVGVQVHPGQYILIGLAQSIFYLLLLAFAERIGFTLAFILAAGLTISATAGYAGSVFGERKYILRAGLVFLLVYGLLYRLMRMQDFALMLGALTSFVAITGTMYLTRDMDWYGLTQNKDTQKV